MNAKQRINELIKRQVFYGSSLVVKLNKIDGQFFYTVYAWYSLDKKTDNKFAVLMNKYNNEDPEDLMRSALKELKIRRIKVGVPQSC